MANRAAAAGQMSQPQPVTQPSTTTTTTTTLSPPQPPQQPQHLVDVHLTDRFPPPVFAGISTSYESEHALFAVRERLTALDGCFALLEALRRTYESVSLVVSGPVRAEQQAYYRKLGLAADHVLHVGCHRLVEAVTVFRNNFPFKLLCDKIAGSQWDTRDYSASQPAAAGGGGGAVSGFASLFTAGGAGLLF